MLRGPRLLENNRCDVVPEIFISAELVLSCVPVNDGGVQIVMVGEVHDYSNHSNRAAIRIKSVK